MAHSLGFKVGIQALAIGVLGFRVPRASGTWHPTLQHPKQQRRQVVQNLWDKVKGLGFGVKGLGFGLSLPHLCLWKGCLGSLQGW